MAIALPITQPAAADNIDPRHYTLWELKPAPASGTPVDANAPAVEDAGHIPPEPRHTTEWQIKP
jgi:hypothetical protein